MTLQRPEHTGAGPLPLFKKYRVFFVTSDSSEVKQIKLSMLRKGFLTLLAILLIIAASAHFLVSSLGSNKSNKELTAEVQRLRKENQAQKFHIQRFSDQLTLLNQQMEKLQHLHAKLKIMANIDLQEQGDVSIAAGGPQPKEPEMSAFLEKSLKQQIHRIHWEIEELQMQALLQERNAYKVEKFFDSQRSLLASTPAIWPVHGWITSAFGHRHSPFTGNVQLHEGLDIAARHGTPVKATADGMVIYSGWKSEYGKTITLDHGYGYQTRYAHLSKLHVKNGKRVKRGDILGNIGNTGRSTGPHLHYEVKVKGLPVDPKKYILN